MFAVAAPMLALGGALRNHDLVFPEGGALAFGVLSLRLPEWRRSPAALAVLPAACAALGVALVHSGVTRWVGELAALTGAFVLLMVLRSRLTPSISAAVFPLVFDVRAWIFPLAVAAIGATLAVAACRAQLPGKPTRRALPVRTALTAWAMLALWVLLGGLLRFPAAALAPPLLVAAVEWLTASERTATTGVRHWMVIVAAAGIGVTAARTIHPPWVGGLLALAGTLLVFRLTTSSSPHPPALAICLIPQVTPVSSPVLFVASIAGRAAVLYLAASRLHPLTVRSATDHLGRSRELPDASLSTGFDGGLGSA